MGSAASSSPDTPAGSAAWAGDGQSRGSQQAGRLLPRASPCPLGSLRSQTPPPSCSPRAPSEAAPCPGARGCPEHSPPCGSSRGGSFAGRGGHGWGRAASTGSSPALGAIVSPPSSQPSFHLLKCKASPVVLLPTALPRSHGSQLPGRRLSKCASRPPPPRHLGLCVAPAAPAAPCQFCLRGGGWARADCSLSRKTPSPPARPQPLASSSGCVLRVGGGAACY